MSLEAVLGSRPRAKAKGGGGTNEGEAMSPGVGMKEAGRRG